MKEACFDAIREADWNDNVIFDVGTTIDEANEYLANGQDGGASGALELVPLNDNVTDWYELLIYLWSVLYGIILGRR